VPGILGQPIQVEAELFDELENYIGDYVIADGDNIIVDIKGMAHRDLNLLSTNMQLYHKCGYCSSKAKMRVKCPCGTVFYHKLKISRVGAMKLAKRTITFTT
jgi:hypothetical protein